MRRNVLVLALLCLLSATVAARSDEAQTSGSVTGNWEGIVMFEDTHGQEGDVGTNMVDRVLGAAAVACCVAGVRNIENRRQRRRGQPVARRGRSGPRVARIITFPLKRLR